jgi:uncharacterized lipoprotein YmbA
VPEYQDRPQIVTQGKNQLLKFAQFDRWGESLASGTTRLIREDLAVILPGAKLISYPWEPSVPVKYQVIVEIVELDSALDKDMFLVAQWQVVDAQNMKTAHDKKIGIPPADHAAGLRRSGQNPEHGLRIIERRDRAGPGRA